MSAGGVFAASVFASSAMALCISRCRVRAAVKAAFEQSNEEKMLSI
jgi:hypothetical protein